MSKEPERIFADVPVGKDWVVDATEAEHTRLKDAVVAAAEAWWLKSFGPTRAIEAENDLVKTVDVLIKFEKENNL